LPDRKSEGAYELPEERVILDQIRRERVGIERSSAQIGGKRMFDGIGERRLRALPEPVAEAWVRGSIGVGLVRFGCHRGGSTGPTVI